MNPCVQLLNIEHDCVANLSNLLFSSHSLTGAGMVSYKNLLQEFTQKNSFSLPHYETERVELGFQSMVRVHCTSDESVEVTSGPQPVKKAAEQEAAKLACIKLNLI